jgi:hypothetical protein
MNETNSFAYLRCVAVRADIVERMSGGADHDVDLVWRYSIAIYDLGQYILNVKTLSRTWRATTLENFKLAAINLLKRPLSGSLLPLITVFGIEKRRFLYTRQMMGIYPTILCKKIPSISKCHPNPTVQTIIQRLKP